MNYGINDDDDECNHHHHHHHRIEKKGRIKKEKKKALNHVNQITTSNTMNDDQKTFMELSVI